MGMLTGRNSSIECIMGTRKVQSLVDTGNQVSIMNVELLKSLNDYKKITYNIYQFI